ncbi:acyl carrier protein [Nucisporomicrobium flavum]|uniref:acyl carrier protein n=1 Tax=Nucisporomicrobium flavum TaxID=2785915 RepID=UPI0018F337DA|nr:acyl carrier protein [Nucisporomicrobium flavum]
MAGDAVNASHPWDPPRGPDPILRSLAPEDQRAYLVGLVRAETATLIGRTEPEAVPAGVTFDDLGLTRAEAIELRDRLAAVCGTELPTDLVGDHPSPDAVAALIYGELFGEALDRVLVMIDSLERAAVRLGADERATVVARLRGLLARFGTDPHSTDDG